jgi:hypothetical protein
LVAGDVIERGIVAGQCVCVYALRKSEGVRVERGNGMGQPVCVYALIDSAGGVLVERSVAVGTQHYLRVNA